MRYFFRYMFFTISFAMSAAILGCGASRPCGWSFVLTVSPTSATVDHMAVPPKNQVQFIGIARAEPDAPRCSAPAVSALDHAVWSNPDPTDIAISSANDETNGTAVCKGATNGPVTLTGNFPPVDAGQPLGGEPNAGIQSVQLTCN